jgi:hypothetical protein
MAYLTNILLQVVDRAGAPKLGVGAMINYPAGGANIQSGSAAGGFYQFTGINAGVYDITVVASGANYITQNYEVKNAYIIPIGESSVNEEGRLYIRSQETVTGAGVLTHNQTYPTGTITGTGYVTNSFNLAFPTPTGTGNLFTETITESIGMAKQTGDRYYHSNQNTTFNQKVRISVA